MGSLRKWIIGICAGAIICGIVRGITPEKGSGRAVRLACGFMTVALLLGPLREFDFEEYALRMTELRIAGGNYASEAINSGEENIRSVIEEKCEAYILDKATELGIAEASATVFAEISDGEEYPFPYSVELGGEATEEKKKKLSSYIEGELGIPGTRQYWSGENEA